MVFLVKSKWTSVMTYHDVDIKSKVRGPERPTLFNKNIASTRPDVREALGKCQGNDTPNTNSNQTTVRPKSGFSHGQTMKVYCSRNSQYGGNRSRRLNSNHDDEVKMTKNAKRIISQASGGLALTKDVKIQICKDPMRSYVIPSLVLRQIMPYLCEHCP